ncbi:hypothetical protein FND50_35050 [Rhodococcus sp. WB9]|nr:hypothetical protein FND50_35050 [Rhodococcus sp. WB9]
MVWAPWLVPSVLWWNSWPPLAVKYNESCCGRVLYGTRLTITLIGIFSSVCRTGNWHGLRTPRDRLPIWAHLTLNRTDNSR